MRQVIVFRVAILAVAAALFVAGTAAAKGASEANRIPAGQVRAVVEYIEGDVTINGRSAEFGQRVVEGDRVQTGKNSQIQIVMNDRNIFMLAENTVAIINIGETVKRVELKTGAFGGVFADLAAMGGGLLQVRTPTTVGGVRGTTFFVKVIDQDNTYICACNGNVEMEDTTGKTDMMVSAPNHEAYLFTRAANGIEVSKQPTLYHSSEGANGLAARIGVTIPWGHVE